MKENLFKKIKTYYLYIIIFIILFNLNIVKSLQDDDDELNKLYYIHFDLSEPGLVVIEKNNPNPEIKDIISESTSVILPTAELDKEGYFFSGWTEDGIIGYEPGNVFLCTSKNTTLKPVLGELSDGRFFRLEYVVEFEGKKIDTGGTLPKGNYVKNRIVKISMMIFPQQTAVHKGWTDGNNIFYQENKIITPEHNVTLRAVFLYYRKLIYDSGNVDGIVGVNQNIQTGYYGAKMDLAENTRLKRSGYRMIAWHCENDGIDYPFYFQYNMPDEDVIMTAVWQPLIYLITFYSGDKSIPNIRIRGETGGIIIAPILENKREGYTFIGWKMYGEDIYYPGDEIVVRGQMPGGGISGTAIWKQN